MSGDQPYVLATSCVAPDREFPSIRALAAAIVALREAVVGRPALRLHPAVLTRNDLPGGQVVSIRLLDGTCAGHGSALGYAFLARDHNGHETALLAAALGLVAADIAA